MRHSWLSVVNLVILITASIVVNMKGNESQDSGQNPTTDSLLQGNGAGTTTSDSMEESTSTASDNHLHATDSSLTTEHTSVYNSQITRNMSSNSSLVNGSDYEYEYGVPAYVSFTEYDMYIFLIDHSEWINSFPGMILNPLCIYITLIMKPFNPTSLFMIALATTDFIVTFTRFAFAQHPFEKLLTDTECTIIFGILNVGLTNSNFILVVWTFERMIAVRFPLKVTTWCTMRNTKIAIIITCLTALCISTPYYIYTRRDIYGGCTYKEFIPKNWTYVDNSYYVWVPMFIICVSNVVIIYSMQQTRKAHAAMTQNAESIEKREREQRKLTIVLVSICASFMIFHIPQLIVTALDKKYPDPFVLYDDPKAFIQFYAFTLLGYEITYLQNSVNFILYCSTGRKFRQTFMHVICFWRAKRQTLDGITSRTNISVVSESA